MVNNTPPKKPRQSPLQYDEPLNRTTRGAFKISALAFGLGALAVFILVIVTLWIVRGG